MSKVINLGKWKYRDLVLNAYDKQGRGKKRDISEKRAQMKRDSKNKF